MSHDSDAPSTRTLPASEPRAPSKRRGGRLLFLILAGFFFVLGVLGAVLPGLPATPFLLLTSFFLARCSPRLNAALLRSRFVGPILVDWQVHGGVQPHVKMKAILFVVLAVAITIVVSGLSPAPALGVVLLAAIGIVVVLRLPRAAPPDQDRNEPV